MDNYHSVLFGLSQRDPIVHVDGYFTAYPADATVLLSHPQNGMPAALMYPYGHGWVIAASLFDDWGTSSGQISADARAFIRDLLSWAVEPGDIPTYSPGYVISVPVSITNTTMGYVGGVRLSLIDPARRVVETHVVSVALDSGASVRLTFDTISATPPGIWRVDATLLTVYGDRMSARVPSARFAIPGMPGFVPPSYRKPRQLSSANQSPAGSGISATAARSSPRLIRMSPPSPVSPIFSQ